MQFSSPFFLLTRIYPLPALALVSLVVISEVLAFPLIFFFFFFTFSCYGSSLLPRLSSSCREQGPLCSFGAQASHCSGFSVAEHGLYGLQASVVVAHGLSSCGPGFRAQMQ